jgi:hypothetical protein
LTHPNLKVANTEADALVGNLRGEIGETITTWILLRQIMAQVNTVSSDDLGADLNNPHLQFLQILRSRLQSDLVSALSELGEKKIGRSNFYFAEVKLKLNLRTSERFRSYIKKNQFKKKRNLEIAHKRQPEKWLDPSSAPIRIPYKTMLKALGLAVRAMKAIDRHHLGPTSPMLWNEVRKKRYQLISPPKVAYILLPHMSLPADSGSKN